MSTLVGYLLITANMPAFGMNPPLGGRETLVRVVNNWNAGVCTGSTRCWSDMTSAWYNEVTDGAIPPFGHWTDAWVKDGNYLNGNIVDSDFADISLADWGRDSWNDRIDEVDVAMVGLHGTDAGGNLRWVGSARVDEGGDGNCNIWQGDMELGETDAEFLHLSSCQSMDQEDWHPEWSESFNGIHQINAFHGVMFIWCSGMPEEYPQRYREFADDSFYIPIALAWLDNMYDVNPGVDNDQCPVSRGVGVGANGEADCWNRMYQERYNNKLSDPDNPTWHGAMWCAPCNPPNKPSLPTE